jgi:hypothetical protein
MQALLDGPSLAKRQAGAAGAIVAGFPDGSQVAGSAAIVAENGITASTPNGHCEFVVGAVG